MNCFMCFPKELFDIFWYILCYIPFIYYCNSMSYIIFCFKIVLLYTFYKEKKSFMPSHT